MESIVITFHFGLLMNMILYVSIVRARKDSKTRRLDDSTNAHVARAPRMHSLNLATVDKKLILAAQWRFPGYILCGEQCYLDLTL